MPHPAPKSKTTKALKRASRVIKRRKEREEFEQFEHLRSQLDAEGNPIDILNADEDILNNEQKFIKRLVNKLAEVDTISLVNYINENINDEIIDVIIYNYNTNKISSSWAESLFRITYECLHIIGLDDFIKRKLFNDMNTILDNADETNKPKMTDELRDKILNELTYDLNSLDFFELINTALLVYSQNTMRCELNGGAPTPPGLSILGFGRVGTRSRYTAQEEAAVYVIGFTIVFLFLGISKLFGY
jgi:hypothetical protein